VSFSSLGLSPELLRAVADQGYETPTPVQLAAIPLVLEGRDLLAGAQTGTGKTAAFVLPIIHRLHQTRRDGTGRHPVRVLVVVPTRELAIQVEESVRTYGAHRPVRSATVYGGVGFGPQVSRLRAGPEVVVATPGRLLDHIGQGTIDLSKVEVLVLDEADRMLDMGFIRDIRKILALLPRRRQNLLFSATFSDDIRGLADGMLDDPASVQVTPRNTTAALVDQLVIPVDRERKRDLLRELVALGRVKQALVFTRTKHGANRLAEQLRRDGIEAAAIHGNRSQSQRVKALDDFKAGRASILVATDIAARGLDIEQLPHVVNFELPMVPEDYVHRIGRTGRAGEPGQAISLVCVDETPLLRAIQAMLKRQIVSEVIPGFEPDRSVRPEPIRLRSTPAERREIAAARQAGPGARQAGPGARQAGPGAGRPAAPGRHLGAAREETAATSAGGAPRHAPRGAGGRNRRSGRGSGSGAPGTGFGNVPTAFSSVGGPRPGGGGHRGRDGRGPGPRGQQVQGHPGHGRDGNGQGSAGQGGRNGAAGDSRHARGGAPAGPGEHRRPRTNGGQGRQPAASGTPRALPGERLGRLNQPG
jgi:ATP-dependent RNA helicase RhlE